MLPWTPYPSILNRIGCAGRLSVPARFCLNFLDRGHFIPSIGMTARCPDYIGIAS